MISENSLLRTHPIEAGQVVEKELFKSLKVLTDDNEGSGELIKYRRGDPIRGRNFFFPESNCQTTKTPSLPPGKLETLVSVVDGRTIFN